MNDDMPRFRVIQRYQHAGVSAAVFLGVLVASVHGGDLGPICPDIYHRCRVDPPEHCCFGHLCCPQAWPCCSGTLHGYTFESCLDPDSDCCSGVTIPEGHICCANEWQSITGPYSCEPDKSCCDGNSAWCGVYWYLCLDLECTPPGEVCCQFGHGEHAPAGGCCTDGPPGNENYACEYGASGCCSRACCGEDLPKCCDDRTDGYGYCCPQDQECCGDTGCCDGKCLTGPDACQLCCTEDDDEVCVFGGYPYCCDGECCGPPDAQECCTPEQDCCDGQCQDVGACCFQPSHDCDVMGECCCDNAGGEFQGVGTDCDPNMCLPMCDDCQPYQPVISECAHPATASNGDPCRTDRCIRNEFDTASCTHYSDRIGPPECDTREVPGTDAMTQKVYGGVTCPPMFVNKEIFFEETYGCGTDCSPGTSWEKACEMSSSCIGQTPLWPPDGRGTKKVCGCPP